jgi:hypothetical protein
VRLRTVQRPPEAASSNNRRQPAPLSVLPCLLPPLGSATFMLPKEHPTMRSEFLLVGSAFCSITAV